MVNSKLRGINRNQAAQILEQLASKHLLDNTNGIFVNDNSIQAFGNYTITLHNNFYKIYKNKLFVIETNTSKHALAWCIADKFGNKILADKIYHYDTDLHRRLSDIENYRAVLNNSSDYKTKFVVLDRLNECLLKVKWLRNQMGKCINQTKYMQQKGFDNETSRLGLKPSVRKITESV